MFGSSSKAPDLIKDTFLVELQTSNMTEQVALRLGYLGKWLSAAATDDSHIHVISTGACVSPPLESLDHQNDTVLSRRDENSTTSATLLDVPTASFVCHNELGNDTWTPDELTTQWVDLMDLTSSPSEQYIATLSSLLIIAGQLHSEVFTATYLEAAFGLLIVGALISLVPVLRLAFGSSKAATFCGYLLWLSAAAAIAALALTGAITYATSQATLVLSRCTANGFNSPGAVMPSVVNVVPGSHAQLLQCVALVLTGVSLALVSLFFCSHEENSDDSLGGVGVLKWRVRTWMPYSRNPRNDHQGRHVGLPQYKKPKASPRRRG